MSPEKLLKFLIGLIVRLSQTSQNILVPKLILKFALSILNSLLNLLEVIIDMV